MLSAAQPFAPLPEKLSMRVGMLEAGQQEVGWRGNCESLPSAFIGGELDLDIPPAFLRLDLK